MKKKNLLFIEPFYKGSHKYFLDNLVKYSKHNITIQTKNGVFWKWKFLESAIANPVNEIDQFDIIIGSNMLNLAPWIGMNRNLLGKAKLALYFHENQLTYPENKSDTNKNEFFGFQNLTSCFCADKVLFNSDYHKHSFISAGRELSKKLPDNIPEQYFKELEDKSLTLPVGLLLNELDKYRTELKNDTPVILWNHRWEFDKNPELFLNSLIDLKKEGIAFKLIMVGSAPKKLLPIFNQAQDFLHEEIIQWGRVESFQEYASLLWRADILPVTSIHDFFGISVLEAIYCKTSPILPSRCAYPDHFSPEEFSDYYYNSDEEFVEVLRSKVLSFNSEKPDQLYPLISKIEKYSWENVGNEFDEIVLKLLQN